MQTSCPHCGQYYDVSAELLGTQVQCTTCTKAFNLPPAPANSAVAVSASPSTASPSTAAPIECACPHCDARFQAPAQMEGTTANCATCHQPFVVEKAETDFKVAPLEGAGPDPFGGLAGDDPLGVSGSSSLGSSSSGLNSPPSYGGPLGVGGASSYPASESSDNSSVWLGVAKILGGVLFGGFGIVATISSYDSANEGESYTVYTGLVIAGIGLAIYGIRDLFVSGD